ncbi:T9SS type A sorting domain-containing protein [bacterium]|nr:T9SS type A sorting domain-containing protein [bacterium]
MRTKLGFLLLFALFVTCSVSHAEIIIVDATLAQIQTNTAYYTSDDSLYVRVTGVVTIPPGTIQTGFCNFYIQDGTGYGISLYDPDPGTASGLSRGTEVRVVGHVHEYYGTTELEDFTWTGLSYNNPLPVPIEFDDMEEFNDSALPWEGSWATLKGIITADYNPQPGETFFFELEDGSGKARIHIYGDTNLDFDAIEAGGIITVNGVIKDGGEHVWLVPALQEDLDFIPIVDATMEEIQTNTSIYMNPDVRVRVSGIITIPSYTVHESFTDAYIQDDSGFGVNLYDPDTTAGDGLVRGRALEIVASVQDYLGTTELVDFQPTHISDDNPLPDPMTFSNTAAFHASATYYEGTWAVLQGIITSDPNPGSWSYNFTINDGSGDATVRIWEDTNIGLSGYAIGDEIVVHGVIDQYNNVPQMMPAMGVDIEFAHDWPVDLDLFPTVDTVPANGGYILYDVQLVSQLAGSYPVRYRTRVQIPNGTIIDVDNIPFTLQPFMNAYFPNRSVYIPPAAPEGIYYFYGMVGNMNTWFNDNFNFTKTGAVDGILNPEDFVGIDALIASDDETLVQLPTGYSVETAYPNPFNPTTTLTVNLPETAELTVTVYNITGQRVATLAGGLYKSGQHEFVFDGENLASGMYFLRVDVPGHLGEMRKLTLMK